MKKIWIAIACVVVLGAVIGMTGCSDDIGTRLDLSTINFSHRITFRHVHTSNTTILISGITDLPDGTVIQSQLYENDILLSWWPSDHEYVVNSGYWEIKVLTEDTEPHEDLIPESSYCLKIWVRDDPSIVDIVVWDTIGPPAVEDN